MIEEYWENVIAKEFGINTDDLYQGKYNANIGIAKQVLWCILHYKENISTGMISKRYKRTRRNVFYALSKGKFLAEKQSTYKAMFNRIYETNKREAI